MKLLSALFTCCTLAFFGVNAYGRTVTDMAGRSVVVSETVETVYTDRFLSLLVYALDPKLLCNRTFQLSDEAANYISSDYLSKPFTKESDEEILKLKPDVLLFANMGDKQGIDEANRIQKRLKIPVLLIDFTVQTYPEVYAFLGKTFNRMGQATLILDFLNQYVVPLRQKAAAIPATKRPRIYYAEGVQGLNTEPAGSFHSQVLDYLYVNNVAKVTVNGVHGMAPVSMEQVLLWKPDVILVWTGYPGGISTGIQGGKAKGTLEHLLTDKAWAKLKAVSDKNVHQIPSLPFGWFDRPPSSNCIPGIFWVAKTLYPGLLEEDMNTALKTYFRLFYHVTITDEHVRYLLTH